MKFLNATERYQIQINCTFCFSVQLPSSVVLEHAWLKNKGLGLCSSLCRNRLLHFGVMRQGQTAKGYMTTYWDLDIYCWGTAGGGAVAQIDAEKTAIPYFHKGLWPRRTGAAKTFLTCGVNFNPKSNILVTFFFFYAQGKMIVSVQSEGQLSCCCSLPPLSSRRWNYEQLQCVEAGMRDFLEDGEKYQDLSWNNWFAAAAAAVAIDDSEKQSSAAIYLFMLFSPNGFHCAVNVFHVDRGKEKSRKRNQLLPSPTRNLVSAARLHYPIFVARVWKSEIWLGARPRQLACRRPADVIMTRRPASGSEQERPTTQAAFNNWWQQRPWIGQ